MRERFDTWKRRATRRRGCRAGVLQIGFHASGRPVAVAVSFDDAAYDTDTHRDASQKQLALGRLADGLSRMMSSRSPAALAGDYHVERF